MANLSGARAKIERANQHIRDLERERASFLARDPHTVLAQYDPIREITTYFLKDMQPIPEIISLIAGDAAHNLRTALDYVAFSLVPAGLPTRDIYFPVCGSPEAYKSQSPGKTKGIPKPFKERIDRLKPYLGGNDAFWGLHRFDIIDKHHLLITFLGQVKTLDFTIDTETFNRAFAGFLRLGPDSLPLQTARMDAPDSLFALKEGGVICEIAGDHETHGDVHLTFDIGIWSRIFSGVSRSFQRLLNLSIRSRASFWHLMNKG